MDDLAMMTLQICSCLGWTLVSGGLPSVAVALSVRSFSRRLATLAF